MHCRRPDGTIPALSDADTGDYGELLELLGAERRRVSSTRASPPAATSPSAAAGSDEARFLIFDCGPLGDGGHGHYDLLSVEAFAGGRPLIVDPGRFTYSEAPPNLRRWFRGTAAHNTVCVDGLDQTPYTRKRAARAGRAARGSSAARRAPASTCSRARPTAPPTRRSTAGGSRSSTSATG